MNLVYLWKKKRMSEQFNREELKVIASALDFTYSELNKTNASEREKQEYKNVLAKIVDKLLEKKES